MGVFCLILIWLMLFSCCLVLMLNVLIVLNFKDWIMKKRIFIYVVVVVVLFFVVSVFKVYVFLDILLYCIVEINLIDNVVNLLVNSLF